MYFSNTFLSHSEDEPLVLTLTVSAAASTWRTSRDVRRTIERWQTKVFVHELMVRTGSPSVYALEEMMMSGVSGISFPDERPKICDRMASRGEPAIVKQLRAGGRKDARTQRWVDRLLLLAPDVAKVVEHPIWRLLDPAPIPYIEWHLLGMTHAWAAFGDPQKSKGSWMIKVTPSDSESEQKYYVVRVRSEPTLIDLETLLLGLRRWEHQGDLVAYDLHLQEAIRVAQNSSPHDSVSVLKPEIADYLAHVFGRVQTPYGPDNRQAQSERVAKSRDAWQVRKLIGQF